jgi:predicted Fe-Mo cluster-binding NifX family protein
LKIVVVTDDEKTISLHFGRAQHYLVFTIENSQIISQELRDKVSHHHDAHDHAHEQHHGEGADDKHNSMLASITDCEALLARGMGRGAYLALEAAHIKPIVTDIPSAEEAVQAYIRGDIVNHIEKLH